jgi:cytochrome c
MAFPGVPEAQNRADILLFLRSKTDSPPPLPEVVAAPAAAEAPAAGAAAPAGDKNAEVAALVAKADPAKGEADAALCKVCHAFEKGAPSPVGPNLYGVIGRPIASAEGFSYSPALKAKAAEGNWDYAHIDGMITNPQAYAPGTMMAFPGLPDAQKRAEVIAWLRTKADSPAPLPEPAAAAPEAPKAEEKPAEAAPAPAAEEKPAEAAPAPATEEKPAEAAPPPAAEEKPAEAPAPAAEEKPAEAPAPEGALEAPASGSTDTPSAAAGPSSSADDSTPSTSTQPQPVYPDGAPQ